MGLLLVALALASSLSCVLCSVGRCLALLGVRFRIVQSGSGLVREWLRADFPLPVFFPDPPLTIGALELLVKKTATRRSGTQAGALLLHMLLCFSLWAIRKKTRTSRGIGGNRYHKRRYYRRCL